MSQVEVWFIQGTAWYSKVIEDVERGEWSHVAVNMGNNALLEAVAPVVRYSLINKYDSFKHAQIAVEIPDYDSAYQESRKLIGTLYGLVDCVNGGVMELTKLQLPGDGELTVNCSETATRIMRAGGVNVLPGIEADCITPQELYDALIKLQEVS